MLHHEDTPMLKYNAIFSQDRRLTFKSYYNLIRQWSVIRLPLDSSISDSSRQETKSYKTRKVCVQ